MSDATAFNDVSCSIACNITSATSQTLSNVVDLHGTALVGLLTPASLTSTAINFRVAKASGDTPVALFNSVGARVSVTCDNASRAISVDPAIFAGWRYVQLEMGSNEGSDRAFTLVTRPV